MPFFGSRWAFYDAKLALLVELVGGERDFLLDPKQREIADVEMG